MLTCVDSLFLSAKDVAVANHEYNLEWLNLTWQAVDKKGREVCQELEVQQDFVPCKFMHEACCDMLISSLRGYGGCSTTAVIETLLDVDINCQVMGDKPLLFPTWEKELPESQAWMVCFWNLIRCIPTHLV
jgi:hypothetical protein